ncbi:MAG: PilZ domain-containing protein [Tepidisphaeraceae bacterium]
MHEPVPSEIDGFQVERRRSHRESVVALGRLTPLDATDTVRPLQVLVTDVSLHGCDFRAALEPRNGGFYRIDLNVGPLTLHSRLRVMRIAPRSDGTFEVGGEFI